LIVKTPLRSKRNVRDTVRAEGPVCTYRIYKRTVDQCAVVCFGKSLDNMAIPCAA
jgi:hypothetical protein